MTSLVYPLSSCCQISFPNNNGGQSLSDNSIKNASTIVMSQTIASGISWSFSAVSDVTFMMKTAQCQSIHSEQRHVTLWLFRNVADSFDFYWCWGSGSTILREVCDVSVCFVKSFFHVSCTRTLVINHNHTVIIISDIFVTLFLSWLLESIHVLTWLCNTITFFVALGSRERIEKRNCVKRVAFQDLPSSSLFDVFLCSSLGS